MVPAYIRDASAAILVFDVTSLETFASVDSWVAEIREQRGYEATIMLAANKIDDEDRRQVTPECGL